MAVEWSEDALEQIARIEERVAHFSGRSAADRWLQRLRDRVHLADLLPGASRQVPEFGMENFREVFEGDYRILYLVVTGGIEVVLVLHGSMDLTSE